jgi:phage terminase small subunit
MKKTETPTVLLHTNKVAASQKIKRNKTSIGSKKALEEGDPQKIIDSLTGLQLRFVEEYLVDMNATEACKRAGYSPKWANRQAFQLMENAAIRYAIDALRMERNKFTDVTKDYVLKKIVKTLESAEDENNHTAVLRAAELLAKHLGMFVDRTEISGPDGKEIEIKNRKVQEEADSFIQMIDKTAKKPSLKVVGDD